jgi:hypothetical protein
MNLSTLEQHYPGERWYAWRPIDIYGTEAYQGAGHYKETVWLGWVWRSKCFVWWQYRLIDGERFIYRAKRERPWKWGPDHWI